LNQYSQINDYKIPKNWILTKLKYFTTKIGSGVTPKGGSDSYVKEGIPLIRSQNVHFDGLHLDNVAYIKSETHEKMSNSKISDYDVLLNITGASIGRTTFIPKQFGEANVSQHVCIIRTNSNLSHRFLTYFLSSSQIQTWISSIQVGASREGLNFEEIGNFILLLPSMVEQNQIVSYLDKKIKSINNKIIKNQKLVKLLKEKKQSEINLAVTKGLDNSVSMEDLGLNGIGEIPKKWEIKKLKFILAMPITDGPHETPTFHDSGIPFLSVDNIQNDKLSLKKLRYITKEDHKRFSLKCKPQRNDLLLGKAASVGKIAHVDLDLEFNVWSPLAVIRISEVEMLSKYCYFMFKTNFLQTQIFLKINWNTQGNIGMKDIKNLLVIIPSKLEQKQIVSYLEKKLFLLDSLISKTELQTTNLQEFKESLISSAVTGQIKVTSI
jgi:type I restriction enzyme, S subunit